MHKKNINSSHRRQMHTQQSHKLGLTNFQGNLTIAASSACGLPQEGHAPLKHLIIDPWRKPFLKNPPALYGPLYQQWQHIPETWEHYTVLGVWGFEISCFYMMWLYNQIRQTIIQVGRNKSRIVSWKAVHVLHQKCHPFGYHQRRKLSRFGKKAHVIVKDFSNSKPIHIFYRLLIYFILAPMYSLKS